MTLDDGTNGEADRPLPLSGLRVIELGYGVAAPTCCRNLAHFGAEVIKVESARRPDSLRQSGSGWLPLDVDWKLWRDTGLLFQFTSSQKRSLGLEIDRPAGRQALERLVAATDVLAMNMSIEAVGHLGLTYAEMRAINPRLIWINMPSFGSAEGPYRGFRTWGRNIAAMSGLSRLVGWPDREPVGMSVNIPDYLAGLWATIGIVSAVAQREQTGEGCELDLSQFQAALACIGPTLMDAQLGGDGLGTLGNRTPGRAPQGVYPSRDDDRWVAISVVDESMWQALCGVAGLESLAADPRFVTGSDRVANHDALDDALAGWTAERSPKAAAAALQAAGVAASAVYDNWDVLSDDQLQDRRQFRLVPHPRFGQELVYGQAINLSDTPATIRRAAPAFGQDTRQVLGEVAGLDAEAVDVALADGTAHEMAYADVHLERPFLHWVKAILPLDWPRATAVDPAAILFDQLKQWNAAEAAEASGAGGAAGGAAGEEVAP